MEVMESPIEALVFTNSIIAVTSLWTWLAVVTAALGFWRIRTIAAISAPCIPNTKQVLSCPADARPPPPPTKTATPQPLASQNVEVCKRECQIASPKKATVFKTTFGGESSLGDNSLLPSGICFEEFFGVKLSSDAYSLCDSTSLGRTSSVQASTHQDEDDGFDCSDRYSYNHESNCSVYRVERRDGFVSNRCVEFHRFQDWTVLNGNVVRLWDKM